MQKLIKQLNDLDDAADAFETGIALAQLPKAIGKLHAAVDALLSYALLATTIATVTDFFAPKAKLRNTVKKLFDELRQLHGLVSDNKLDLAELVKLAAIVKRIRQIRDAGGLSA